MEHDAVSVMAKNSDNAEFMFAFGNFVILWNHLEMAGRDLLVWLAGGNITATILANQAGNVTLTDTIRNSADWHPVAAAHLIHFCKIMDTIRAYRNYYVHNLIGVAPVIGTGEPVGLVLSLSVRGKYTLYEKALKTSELDELSQHCDEARKYGLTILAVLKNNVDVGGRAGLFGALAKPSPPPTLTKTVRDPTAP